MKRIFSILGLTIFLTIFTSNAFTQTPPPPPPPNPGNSSPGPVGGSAALEGGLALLVLMAVSYGVIKYMKKQTPAETEIN
jgi:hypothetical protein